MKTTIVLFLALLCASLTLAQTGAPADSAAKAAAADSVKRAKAIADSLHMEHLFSIAQYPWLKGSKWSGVLPVDDPTEVPETGKDYKLLFEFTSKNPDSLAKEINTNLDEVARLLNLHYASGIRPEHIKPVILIHGPGIRAVTNNESYQKRYQMDNPNIRLLSDMEKIGAKVIVCGQAMQFFKFERSDLLPEVKVSRTAQTVLSDYTERGYVVYKIEPDK